jgi:protein involved in polysaccharide export with SLBB domain
MKMPLARGLALLAPAFGLLFTGCEHMRRPAKQPAAIPASFTPTPAATTAALDPGLLQRPTAEYRLGPGDVLQIEIINDLTTRQRNIVGPDGKIYYSMLPGIDVWGLTVAQARDRLVQEMQKFIREPQPIALTLIRAESQRIWVLGRLNKPGVYGLGGPMTLLEAISEAGGPSAASAFATGTTSRMSMAAGRNSAGDEAADLNRSFVIREGRMLPVDFQRLLREGDMSQNIYLQPGDFIYMPSNRGGNVHVLGAVTSPRAVDYAGNLTLLQSIALAGGTIPKESYLSHVAIVRGSLTNPQVAVVDFDAIVHGRAPDLALEPQDIVYVPHSPYRVLNRYIDLILDTFVRTVGVNEGARAVSDRAVPLGVTVPLGPL